MVFFIVSAVQFANDPTWANAGWLALDVLSLAPILPSIGWLKYGDEGLALYNRIADGLHALDRAMGLSNAVEYLNKVMARFGKGAARILADFFQIAKIPGAEKILKNLANGAWATVIGTRFELEYAVKFADDIAEIGRKLGGGYVVDFVLKSGAFVEVKNYNWAAEFYQNAANLQKVIDRFLRQLDKYKEFTDTIIFVFKGSVPDEVRAALEAAGATVEVIK